MMTRLAFVILAACTAAPPATMKVPPPRHREVKLADLGDARPFRNYIAVTHVGPQGAHFTAWYHHIEPAYMRVVAYSDGAGHLVISEEAGGWGGIAMPPHTPPPISRNVEKLAHTVEAELQRRKPEGRDWQIRFDGLYRAVGITELIAHDFRSGTQRSGWNAHVEVAMDADLTKVERPITARSGFGLIEVPADAQWVELPFAGDGRELLVANGVPPVLVTAVADAARRHAANQPSPALASLVPPGGRMLPDGYVAQVAARVSVSGRELRVPLDLHDAVFAGGAAGEKSVDVDDRRYTVRVTLAPDARRTPTPGHASERYAGTLRVRVDDGKGHMWEHAYPATGRIELEGSQVVAPVGFDLPGASAPSKEADALHGALPGFGKITSVDVYVDVGVYAAPAR